MKQTYGLYRRALALLLALILIASPLSLRAAAEGENAGSELVLESKTLTPFAQGEKSDGETERINDVFSILWSSKSKVDGSTKEWEDGYVSDQRINFGGKVSTTKNAVQITLTGPAVVKIWWVQGGDDNREMALLDANGEIAAITSGTYAKNSPYFSELELEAGGVYYLGGATNNNNIYKVEVVPAAVTHILESKLLEPFAAGDKADGDTTAVGDFFTLIWSSKSKVDSSAKTWDDDYESNQRINFGGKVTTTKNAVRFETAGPALVKIWWVQGGDDNREMAILNADGEIAAITSGTYVKNSPYISELELEEGGTWYLGGATNNNNIYKVEVTTGASEKPPRADWAQVADPAITDVSVEGGNITVTVSALVGYDGADKVTVEMCDEAGSLVDSKSSGREQEEHALVFTPSASGTYTFAVSASRNEEESVHNGAETRTVDFTLPLAKPAFISASNAGSGTVHLEWEPVPEAEQYEIAVANTEILINTQALEADVTGLTAGASYTFLLTALRGQERSETDSIECTVTEEAEVAWAFSAFGTGVNLSNAGYEGSANEGSVKVWSTGGKGKLVPASTDGLSFYYTKIDPATQNFKLTAKAVVESWTYSNGQEGFGVMACDAVGRNGDSSTFWNNSYMASVTKVEYSTDAGKYSMKLGVGSQQKIGVTPENINASLQLDDMSLFSSTMRTLETSCADAGNPAGTYNLVGRYTNASAPDGTVDPALTEFVLTVEKNNTGYFVSYTDPAGVVHTEKYYDVLALNHLDAETVYAGFFASRNATVEFTDIEFTTSDPATDPPPEEQPVTLVEPNFLVESATIANSADYTLVYFGNADGILTVTGPDGSELYNGPVSANEKLRVPAVLQPGSNSFALVMTPDPDYKPSEFERLSSYEPVSFTHTVSFTVNDAKLIYVSPDGDPAADGLTRETPTDLSLAVQRAVPGQTICLLEGVYHPGGKLVLERGIDGTEAEPICLFTDPEAESRPVLDFETGSAGLIVASNWWHLKGFDVTRSANGEKGVQVSGKHNVLELLETYRNGNTGIQISRYKGSDQRDEWPADNLILNCTSYLNADRGYEDADGFAAKLTIGEGNVFDGCIAHHNADDGWDLYAKIENGPIGKVVIQNSVAYKNGYILDEAGNEINAGNGNGFKMGGESIPGGHTLINSIAFANKAKGIDSNSCPDIKAYQSTSFDNESYNVAFYTNTAVNTDFAADGVLSYKKSNTVAENIKPVGSQDQAAIYGPTNFYYKDGKFENSEGLAVADDWFVSLDTEAAINGGVTRNPDGSINMNGYLERTDKVPEGVGADFPAYEAPVELPFEDVSPDAYYHDPVVWALENNVTCGVDASHFAPDQNCTRAEIITFLWRADGSPMPESNENPFTDVPEDAYYRYAAIWALEKGITAGAGGGKFDPNGVCTRAQLACFLWRYKGSPAPAQSAVFTDVPADAYYADAAQWAAESGITAGIGNGCFGPDLISTRAQAIAMLYKCCQ